jgi:hypothetical protein
MMGRQQIFVLKIYKQGINSALIRCESYHQYAKLIPSLLLN